MSGENASSVSNFSKFVSVDWKRLKLFHLALQIIGYTRLQLLPKRNPSLTDDYYKLSKSVARLRQAYMFMADVPRHIVLPIRPSDVGYT
jgi:hypothetical protein